MAVLTPEMKEVVEKQRVGYIATSSKAGVPNVSPKGTVKVVDDETLAFACVMSEKTIKNLQENPKIAVAVADAAAVKGFQFKGEAKLETSGTLFDEMAAQVAKMKLPKPKCIARIKVTEVYPTPPRAKG